MSRMIEKVIAFSTRSLADPRPLINYVYGTFIEELVRRQRTGSWEIKENSKLESEGKNLNGIAILQWLYDESKVPLLGQCNHNRHVNHYNHDDDDRHSRPRDTTPLHVPSKLYQFIGIKDDIEATATFPDTEGLKSVIRILWPCPKATNHLLDTCHKISKHQPVMELQLLGVQFPDIPAAEAPILSRNTRSIWVSYCDMPVNFTRSLLRQLVACVTLEMIRLDAMDLREIEGDLDELLEHTVSHHENGAEYRTSLRLGFSYSILSEGFKTKWKARCEGASIPLELYVSYYHFPIH